MLKHLLIFTYHGEHIEKGWACHKRLQTDIHEAVDIRINKAFINLVELGHGELDIRRQLQIDVLVIKLLASRLDLRVGNYRWFLVHVFTRVLPE